MGEGKNEQQSAQPSSEGRSGSSSFRIAGLVAQAARRFSRSINPPVTFGKPLPTSTSSDDGTTSPATVRSFKV